MIVTIDGPAGAGKSSTARKLARRLGFRFLDTGAMYRAVALAALREGISGDDSDRLAELVARLSIEVDDQHVLLDGQDVSDEIRSSEVTRNVRFAADNLAVRRRLGQLQRKLAEGCDVVTEGRDQGSEVFPNAECKIFLTATPGERARRRWQDLQARGESIALDDVLVEQNQRDEQDANRPVGPLVRAGDAVEVLTDGLAEDEVVDRLAELVLDRRPSP